MTTPQDNRAFVTLVRVAAEDEKTREILLRLVSLPGEQRRDFLGVLVRRIRGEGAPPEFADALAALADDQIAATLYEHLTD